MYSHDNNNNIIDKTKMSDSNYSREFECNYSREEFVYNSFSEYLSCKFPGSMEEPRSETHVTMNST